MEFTEKLKTKTHTLHQAVEQLHHFSQLLSNQLTHNDYARLVALLFRFYHHIETQINMHEWSELHPNLKKSNKSKLLNQDANNLNADPFRPSAVLLNVNLESQEQCIGSMYVIEGAALGGKIISKHLSSLTWMETGFMHFYNASAKQPANTWRNFKLALNETAAMPWINDEQIIEGARKTFLELINFSTDFLLETNRLDKQSKYRKLIA